MPKMTTVFAGLSLFLVLTGCSMGQLGQRSSLVVGGKVIVSTLISHPASFSLPSGCVMDSSGNLYISDWSNNAIRKISPSGVVTTLAGGGGTSTPKSGFLDGTGTQALFNQPAGMDIDGNGNLYVADYGNHAIRKVTPSGVVTTIAGGGGFNITNASTGSNATGTSGFQDANGTNALFRFPTGVALDGSGNIYVVDYNNQTVRQIDLSGNVSTVVGGQNPATFGYTDATTSVGAVGPYFTNPGPIVYDRKNSSVGNTILYVGDSGNYAVRKLVISGSTVAISTFACGGGVNPGIQGFLDGTGIAARSGWIAGLAFDPNGNLYVTDSSNHAVRIVDSTGVVKTLAGGGGGNVTGSPPGISGYVNDNGTAARFYQPGGVVVDSNGIVYVCDGGNNVMRKITSSGDVTTYAGQLPESALAGPGFTDGRARGPGLKLPYSIARDSAGNLYVPDRWGVSSTYRLWKIDPLGDGQMIGLNATPTFQDLAGVAVVPDGTVYVTDPVANLIRIIDTTGTVTTLTSSVTKPDIMRYVSSGVLYVSDSGSNRIVSVGTSAGSTPALLASVNSPLGFGIAKNGDLYVASGVANKVWKVNSLTKTVSPFAGTGAPGMVNGPIASATLHAPNGVAVADDGTIYVAEYSDIRMISVDGTVSLLAGSTTPGTTDGPGKAAKFDHVTDLIFDPDGNLLVADYGNGLIRKITFK